MRNLIRFIVNKHFFFLFLLFEVIALTLVFQNNNYHKAAVFNVSRSVSGYIDSKVFAFRQYLGLHETNRKLVEENTLLRNSLISSYKLRIRPGQDTEFDSAWVQQYNFIPARVVSNSVNKQNNFITIDIGSVHGVTTDMAVISHNGVTGIVAGVSDHFSTVIPLLNSDLRISSRHKRSGYFGSLGWDGTDPTRANLYDITHDARLSPGDTIVTSGYSAIFPRGILIGTIDDFDLTDGNFYSITVNLSTDFRRLKYVYVIENRFRDELIDLEGGESYD